MRRALTIVELLVVISIAGLLMAIVLPAVQQARETSRKASCKNNLRQVALATMTYHDARGRFPHGYFIIAGGVGPDARAWSWLARLLPYAERNDLYDRGRVGRATLRQSRALHEQVSIFLCPSDEYSLRGPRGDAGDLEGMAVGQTNYQGVTGANWGADGSQQLADIGTDWRNMGTNGSYDGLDDGDGIMWRSDYRRVRSLRHVEDGVSHTFLAGECAPQRNRYVSWPYANNAYATCAIPPNVVPVEGRDYSPNWWPNVNGFRSHHPGGLHFARVDASVAWLSDAIDLAAYRARATIAGGD
ncbi:MAG: hypothetical protein DCC67_19255 [Planctomycetota bacterium]|nr:MAG: hypothetical protein DCC67_19255 [Planctomycetota bacterium]